MIRKILSLVLALLLLTGLCTVVSAGEVEKQFASSYNGHAPISLTNTSVGHYFEIKEGFLKSYSAVCPSYSDNVGSVTITMYKWAGSYGETLKGTPIAQETYVNFNDNAKLSISPKGGGKHFGKFLVTFTNPVQQVGVWKISKNLNEEFNSAVYINGVENKGNTLNASVICGDTSTVNISERVTIPYGIKENQFASDYNGQAAINLSNTTVGHYFEVNDGFFKNYNAICPSYDDNIGDVTLTLYKWAGSYYETLNTTPLAQKTYTNFNNNEKLSIWPDDDGKHSGAFLVTFTNPVQRVGVWKVTKNLNAEFNSSVYINGVANANTTLNGSVYVADTSEISVADINRISRDAYSRIQAETFDNKTNGYIINNSSVVVNVNPTVLAYADVNFGSISPKGMNMNIYPYSVNDYDCGEIQVYIDDPIVGKKIGDVYFEVANMLPAWETVSCKITETVTGVHDVYFVCDNQSYYIDWFQFSKTTPGESRYEKRLKEFVPATEADIIKDYSDTWSATDMMGRKLPGFETVGAKDEERQVAIFYHSWHARAHMARKDGQTFNNNQQTIKNYIRTTGGSEEDIKNVYNHPVWSGRIGHHYWNESIYGYYHGMDTWVMRKQMELFAAAGIDALFTDCTNGNFTWLSAHLELMRTSHEMQKAGIKAPAVSFLMPFSANGNTTKDLRKVYQTIFQTGLYSDTWYYWDGKPIVMAYPGYLDIKTGYDDIDALNDEIRDYFTFRPCQPDYRKGSTMTNMWCWAEVYPQHGFVPLTNSKYNYEMVGVSVAQNGNDDGLTAMNGPGAYGRSFTYKDRYSRISEESKYYGYNFAEEWERAYELNPKLVYITGWNEWIAGHYTEWQGVTGAFPDQYSDEYSRDIEPTKGDFKDNYYYQMVGGIRKFKGVNPTPVASAEKTIRIGGAFSQFDDVGPVFYGYTGGTNPREYYSVGQIENYYNGTGRNDIVLSKVARDADNLYFYVKTNANLTSHTDPSWMRLFINTDRKYKTGWEGYDFAVNIEKPTSSTSTTLSYTADGWNWKTAGTLTYKYSGNQMMIRVPRAMMGLTDSLIDIEFKWIDNMQNQGDIIDVYNNGDTAPIGRFAYRYTETTDYDKTPVDEPVTVSELKLNQYKYSVILSVGKTTAFAGGKQKTLDTAPEIINGKTMVPLRFFSEGFGAEVKWNDATRTATVNLDGKTVSVTIGKNTMDANGTEKALESPAVIKNGRTLVPMRDIAESLGKKVHWVDGGLIIAGENPETVHSYEWVQDMTEDYFGIR